MDDVFSSDSGAGNSPDSALPCSEKLAFDTRQQAEATATVAQYQHGTVLHAYVCRHCGLWHLSSN